MDDITYAEWQSMTNHSNTHTDTQKEIQTLLSSYWEQPSRPVETPMTKEEFCRLANELF